MSNIQIRDFSSYTDLLPVQFNDSENLIKLLTIYLDQVQELNLAQQDLSNLSTDINTATGYQLDIIGNLLGTTREGRLDEDYRTVIQNMIAVNTGSGTPNDVIGFLKTLTKANKVRYWEHYPASIILETDGESLPLNLVPIVDNTAPAGVRLGGIIVVEDNYAFRPCRLSEAYLNYVEVLGDPDEGSGDDLQFEMGEDLAYMGNPVMEMVLGGISPTGEFIFTSQSLDTFLGQSVLPNSSEVYTRNISNMAGRPNMVAGNITALAEVEDSVLPIEGAVQGLLASIRTH